jgi:type II secretory pathway component PulM
LPFNKTELLQRWAALSSRERLLLMAGLTAVLIAAVYGFVYEPMQAENRRLQQQLQAQQQIYMHLRDVAERVAQLRQSGAEIAVTPMAPAAAIADSSKQLGLDAFIGQQKTDPEGGVELELHKMPFDKLSYWLAVLQQQHAIVVTQLDVGRYADDSTLLDGKLTLTTLNRGPE